MNIQKTDLPFYCNTSFFYDFPQSFGATAGVQFPIHSKEFITSFENGKEKKKYRNLILGSDAGFYRYAFNNTGLFFFQSIGKEYYKSKPAYFEWLASIGILRTFYDGIIYSVDDNGNVHTLNNFGRYYATVGFSAVFGHNFEKGARPKPFSIAVKPSLWVQYPYNNFLLPHLSLQATFDYHFRSMNVLVKQKQVIRFHQQ